MSVNMDCDDCGNDMDASHYCYCVKCYDRLEKRVFELEAELVEKEVEIENLKEKQNDSMQKV